jgi:CO/xanthine dehydrogenase FAD-binding subunit
MKPFTFERATTPAQAAAAVAVRPGAKFVAGGTNLLDLMKLQIEAPTHLVDVNGIGLDRIERTPEGGLRVGRTAHEIARPLGATSCMDLSAWRAVQRSSRMSAGTQSIGRAR